MIRILGLEILFQAFGQHLHKNLSWKRMERTLFQPRSALYGLDRPADRSAPLLICLQEKCYLTIGPVDTASTLPPNALAIA